MRLTLLILLTRTIQPVAIRTVFRNVCLDALTDNLSILFKLNNDNTGGRRAHSHILLRTLNISKLTSVRTRRHTILTTVRIATGRAVLVKSKKTNFRALGSQTESQLHEYKASLTRSL
ncbi:unnamed protein product [Leptidea sinapis]|uniref:Secreted protein n=1 Tax=Leptidea sinapis TaxID=189913 RepID=A0A5E4QXY4_9NEOP|nr:unnamed protein product [Leptidea sinapis]